MSSIAPQHLALANRINLRDQDGDTDNLTEGDFQKLNTIIEDRQKTVDKYNREGGTNNNNGAQKKRLNKIKDYNAQLLELGLVADDFNNDSLTQAAKESIVVLTRQVSDGTKISMSPVQAALKRPSITQAYYLSVSNLDRENPSLVFDAKALAKKMLEKMSEELNDLSTPERELLLNVVIKWIDNADSKKDNKVSIGFSTEKVIDEAPELVLLLDGAITDVSKKLADIENYLADSVHTTIATIEAKIETEGIDIVTARANYRGHVAASFKSLAAKLNGSKVDNSDEENTAINTFLAIYKPLLIDGGEVLIPNLMDSLFEKFSDQEALTLLENVVKELDDWQKNNLATIITRAELGAYTVQLSGFQVERVKLAGMGITLSNTKTSIWPSSGRRRNLFESTFGRYASWDGVHNGNTANTLNTRKDALTALQTKLSLGSSVVD